MGVVFLSRNMFVAMSMASPMMFRRLEARARIDPRPPRRFCRGFSEFHANDEGVRVSRIP